MRRSLMIFLACGAVAACSTEPAGGRGPFDPIPTRPAGDVQPISVTPPTGAAPIETEPTEAQNIPTAQGDLASDVRNALGSPVPAADPQGDPGTGIDPNDQAIDLNQFSQEEQRRQREEDARRIAEARARLVVVEPTAVEQVNPNINVASFARETTHALGTRLYNRGAFRSRSQSNRVCAQFASADDAQRRFLGAGGPETDEFNLDPDGDGFACGFDPRPYRALSF
ncbi:MAG: hypothetical protein AAFR93_00565 [Pseudomonadota bacterium]